MKELNYVGNTQFGLIKGVLRVIGKIIYLKFNNNQYSKQIIEAMKQKGALIEISKDNSWIRVDFIKDSEVIKLGENEIDLTESSNEQIEEFIYNFYKSQYKKQRFIVK